MPTLSDGSATSSAATRGSRGCDPQAGTRNASTRVGAQYEYLKREAFKRRWWRTFDRRPCDLYVGPLLSVLVVDAYKRSDTGPGRDCWASRS
jgi:hypothetical protein